jgi:hypothetical protein
MSQPPSTWRRRPMPRYGSWSRYLPLLSAGVALAAAAIAFFTTGESLADLKLLVGFCIALLTIALPVQFEVLRRVTERATTREQLGRLLEAVEDYPDLLPIITRTAEASVATLTKTNIEEFKDFVGAILIETQIRMQELEQGRLRTSSGDNALLLTRFAAAEHLVQATTDEEDTKWWRQANGKQFFLLNKQLIDKSRGEVERVWILRGPPSTETVEVLEEQRKAKVRVFVVSAKDVDDAVVVNMTMMDSAFLHEDVTNKHGQVGEYLFTANPADLARAKQRFSRLKARAHEYNGPSSLDGLFESS